MATSYRGRFAPTPSGPLHFGSLVTALGSWLDARQQQGEWWLRIDDIDPPREQPGAADTICRQLDAFGLGWDKKLLQSQRSDHYQAAIEQLLAQGDAFHCALSRTELAAFPDGHPGKSVGVTAAPDTAIRLAVDANTHRYHDLFQPHYSANLQALGGAFVIRRRDGLFAYHLACAVDDAQLGMTHVLRGADLLASTPQQCWLLHCLHQPLPCYGHLPLVLEKGVKLGKSVGSAQLDPAQRETSLLRAMHALGMTPPADLAQASVADILAWGVAHWSRDSLPSAATDIHQI